MYYSASEKSSNDVVSGVAYIEKEGEKFLRQEMRKRYNLHKKNLNENSMINRSRKSNRPNMTHRAMNSHGKDVYADTLRLQNEEDGVVSNYH